MLQAELRGQIGTAIPRFVECLKASRWGGRHAAISVLSSLGAFRMCPSVSLLLVS